MLTEDCFWKTRGLFYCLNRFPVLFSITESCIAEKAREHRFILVIDEFPYLATSDKSIKSILQNLIDHDLRETNLFLILCGSQISFMERQVLGGKSPLFGRRTAQFNLVEGFDYYDAAKMLPGVSNEDKIKYDK